jgi:Ca2+-binding RTX toxin-like protein
MASIPGSHYDIFAPKQSVSFGVTADPNTLPPPVSGDFNLEVITNASGTGSFATAAGYQGLAILSTNGNVLTALHGNYGVVDAGANDLVMLGDGSESIGGAFGDTLVGGTGLSQFLDAHLGGQSVIGGSGGGETIWGGAGDTIQGSAGANVTIGGVAGDTVIGGSSGNEFIDGSRGNQSITGGNGANDSIWGGPGDTISIGNASNVTVGGNGDTLIGGNAGNQFIDGSAGSTSIVGGSGGNETIWGGVGDTIQGGSGGNETIAGVSGETITGGAANTFFDATSGNESIVAGSGNSTIWGGAHDTVQGASGSGSALIGFAGGNETFWDNGATSNGHDSVSTFSQPGGDRVSLNSATDTIANVLGSATTDGAGNTTVTLHDGSTITFIGISGVNSGFFTTH